MKAVVTGAGGHIGFNVALKLLHRGYEVVLLVRKENDNLLKLKNQGAYIVYADLFTPESYADAMNNADVLFHLAAENTTAIHNRSSVLRNTFELTRTVVDTALLSGVKTIVYTSSVVVLGRSKSRAVLFDENNLSTVAESPYVEGKILAETYCRKLCTETGADIRIVYPSWVVGDGDMKGTPPHRLIIKFLEAGEKFTFNGGISVAHVSDVAEGHVNTWLHGRKQDRFVLAGQNITFRQFYEFLAIASNKKKPILNIPKPFIVAGAHILKLVKGKNNPIDPEYAKSVVNRYSWYNSEKAVREIGYQVRSVQNIIESGIRQASAIRLQVNKIYDKKTIATVSRYSDDDILLITGFPGWLSCRMVDIMINGDYFGKNKIKRKVRLLVQQGISFNHDLPSDFEIFYGNLNDKTSLLKALTGVKCVYHLAGLIYPRHIADLYKVNTEGTIRLVDACIASGVNRFIFVSTDSVCGYSRSNKNFSDDESPRPYKNYGRSKYLAEKYLFEKTVAGEISGTVLRGFWFFGPFAPPRNKNFYIVMKRKLQPVFGNGKNKRSITHIDNLVQSFIRSEKANNTSGKWYWIGDGSGTLTVNEICSNITNYLGVKYNPLHIPGWCCDLFGMLDSFLGWFGYLNPTIHAAGKFHKTISARSDHAVQDFGYEPNAGFEQIKIELKLPDS